MSDHELPDVLRDDADLYPGELELDVDWPGPRDDPDDEPDEPWAREARE